MWLAEALVKIATVNNYAVTNETKNNDVVVIVKELQTVYYPRAFFHR